MKKWIQFADLCADPTDVFAYLRANSIGLCHALFWEAWAVVLEMKGSHALADKAYVEGIERAAQPLKRLRRSHQAFITRMARRVLDQVNNPDASVPPSSSSSAPSSVRDALATLPTRDSVVPAQRAGAPRLQQGIPSSGASAPLPNASFRVFDENASAAGALHSEANQLPGSTGSHADPWAEAHAKENTRRAEKWSDFRVPQSKIVPTHQGQAQQQLQQNVTFTVFDESGIADTKPDTSRERQTEKGVEALGYEPLLMFFDRTATGGGYEESQMEEHRGCLPRYAYEESSDDNDTVMEDEEDDGDDAMEQTMVVGRGLRVAAAVAKPAPVAKPVTAKPLAVAVKPSVAQSISVSPLARLDDLRSPVASTPAMGNRVLHTPGTAAQIAIAAETTAPIPFAAKLAMADDRTVCTREAHNEIDAMFSETLQVWQDDGNKSHNKSSDNSNANNKPAKRGALTARKVTMGDVLTSWKPSAAAVEADEDAQRDDSAALAAVLGGADDNGDDGTGNSGSFLHRLHGFGGDDDGEDGGDYEAHENGADPLFRGDDDGVLLGDATSQTDRTFEIFREATVELQKSKHAALAQVTPLLSATARSMREKENAFAPPAALNVAINDGDTTSFVVFEEAPQAAAKPERAPTATVKVAAPQAEADDEEDDEEDDGQSLVNPALIGRLRKMSIGRVRTSKRYDGTDDDDEDDAGAAATAAANSSATDDDDEDASDLLNPALMGRLRNSIGVSLGHRNLDHGDTVTRTAGKQSALDRLLGMRKPSDPETTAQLASSTQTVTNTRTVTQTSLSSDSLEHSPPNLSHHTTAGLLALEQSRRKSSRSSCSTSSSVAALAHGSSPTVAIAQRQHIAKPLAGGAGVVLAGVAVQDWLDALECDMLLLTNVHDARPGKMPEANAAALLELESCSVKVQRELGRGARGVVSLVERVDDITGANLASESTLAMKRWTCSDAIARASWSFWLSAEVHRRLAVDLKRNFLQSRTLELYGNGAVLLTEHAAQATLGDAITAHVRRSKPIDEPLAMYYTIELLRLLAPLHRAGVLHMALDAHHLLVRNDQCANWNNWAVADRELNGWDTKGLIVIDFSNGIDRQLYPAGTTFAGEVPGVESQCGAVRDGRAWTIEPDVYGVACIAHELAFGTKLAMRKLPNGRWALSNEIKRVYHVPLWSKLFDMLLNIDGNAPGAIDALDQCRQSIEQYLTEKPLKAKAIKTALCRQQIMLFESRK